MKKVTEISLKDILSEIPSEPTLYERLLDEFPIGYKANTKILLDYYKVNKNTLYPNLQRLVDEGYLKKYKQRFNGRDNVNVFERVK